jgi:hypothetical protein
LTPKRARYFKHLSIISIDELAFNEQNKLSGDELIQSQVIALIKQISRFGSFNSAVNSWIGSNFALIRYRFAQSV